MYCWCWCAANMRTPSLERLDLVFTSTLRTQHNDLLSCFLHLIYGFMHSYVKWTKCIGGGHAKQTYFSNEIYFLSSKSLAKWAECLEKNLRIAYDCSTFKAPPSKYITSPTSPFVWSSLSSATNKKTKYYSHIALILLSYYSYITLILLLYCSHITLPAL